MSQPDVADETKKESEKAQFRLIYALCFGILATQLDSRIVAPILPSIGAELHVKLSQSGWLLTAYLVPYGLFQLFYGPIASKFGKLPVIIVSMSVFGVGTLLGSYWLSLPIMISLRVLTGAAAAAIFPLSLAYVGDTVPYEKRQAVIGLLMTSSGVAAALSASLGGIVASLFSWQWVFPFLGLVSLCATFSLITSAKFELKSTRLTISESLKSYRSAISSAKVPSLLLLVGFEGALYLGSIGFWGDPLAEKFGLKPYAIGLIMCVTGLAQLSTAKSLKFILRYLTESRVACLGGTFMSLAYFLVATINHWQIYILGCAFLGAGFTLCHSTLQTKATEMYPPNRSTALGMFAFSLFLGAGLGSALFARLDEFFGFRKSSAVICIFMLLFTVFAQNFIAHFNQKSSKSY